MPACDGTKDYKWVELKPVTLNDLDRHNDRRPALSLRQLSFMLTMK